MQGKKTHEQMLRTLERKHDLTANDAPTAPGAKKAPPEAGARQSEFPVSRHGMHQESRDHNKHNDPGQSGHGPQEPSPSQEKKDG